MEHIIKTENLSKEFRTPFTFKKINALTDLRLQITRGEVFGFLGPNGAGKTTTFKLLLGLLHPTRGKIFLWGKDHYKTELKSKIGFLPESPYFYSYLKAKEYLHLCGQLCGINYKERQRKLNSLMERVGLGDHKDSLIKTFSKGMLQRLGLAQALINDPELLILDEPLSGLDPLGRKEVKDIMLELKAQGKTIIFSTHILSDIETVCDRVGIIIKGRLKDCGPIENLLNPKIKSFEICIKGLPIETINNLRKRGLPLIQRGEEAFIQVEEMEVNEVLHELLKRGGELISLIPRKETLEDIYVSQIKSIKK
jgi:ABC-type multidrug transport system, ATPase component